MSFISRLPLRSDKNKKLPNKDQAKPANIPYSNNREKSKFYKRKWFIATVAVVFFLLLAGGIMAYKTGYVLNKISESDNSILKSLLNVLPVVGKDELKVDEDGRINVLLLGMRGENIPGGGLLADSIMVISLNTQDNKVAMISIPRDLYVKYPGTQDGMKINAVHAHGESKGKGNGLKSMETIVGEVTGLKINYAVSINFVGFKQMIDKVGGIDINLETPFYETHQFVEGKECGIEFSLAAGANHLDGEKALCYARARDNTSDFDRARRQQVILLALKDKLISMGTLSDFGKINDILNVIGDNVRTDMASYEMKEFYERYAGMKDAQVYRRVFENSEAGLLMVPSDSHGKGYILVPRAGEGNYSQIQEVCKNIFTIPQQNDIDPMKQYRKPAAKEIQAPDLKKNDKKKKDDDEKDEPTVKSSTSSKESDSKDSDSKDSDKETSNKKK